MSVVDEQLLQATATHHLIQFARQIPAMIISRAPDNGLALTLRGIATPAQSQAFDHSIASLLEGTYLVKGGLYSIALLDDERLEVLRRPHGSEVGSRLLR